MSEYKGIKGFQVQTRTEDPVPYAQALADNPYAGSWASGGRFKSQLEDLASGIIWNTNRLHWLFGGRINSSPGSYIRG